MPSEETAFLVVPGRSTASEGLSSDWIPHQSHTEVFKTLKPTKNPVKALILAGFVSKWRCRGEALLRKISAQVKFLTKSIDKS